MVSASAIDLAEEFGTKTTTSMGKVHNYLVIDMYFESTPGTLIIYQIKYLQKILEEFPEVLTSSKDFPDGDHLFKIREDKYREILCEDMAKQFHCTVALFLKKMQERTTRP